jgi:hypothetical protein
MNRRNFLSLFPGAIAGIALHQAIPFNRVWSFPRNISYRGGVDFAVGESFSIRTTWHRPSETFVIVKSIEIRSANGEWEQTSFQVHPAYSQNLLPNHVRLFPTQSIEQRSVLKM